MEKNNTKINRIRNMFLIVLGFLALGAIGGGAVLIISPTGEMMGLPVSSFKNMPFNSFLIPGIILSLMFAFYNLSKAVINPKLAPEPDTIGDTAKISSKQFLSGMSIIGLIIVVLGGIWGGIFTPTEAAGMGALASFAIALFKGMRWKGIVESVIDAGKTSAPIMILLITYLMNGHLNSSTGKMQVMLWVVVGK